MARTKKHSGKFDDKSNSKRERFDGPLFILKTILFFVYTVAFSKYPGIFLELLFLGFLKYNAAVERTPTEPPYGGGGGDRAWDRKLLRNFWDRDRRSARTACLTDFYCPKSEKSMPLNKIS